MQQQIWDKASLALDLGASINTLKLSSYYKQHRQTNMAIQNPVQIGREKVFIFPANKLKSIYCTASLGFY